MEAGNPSYQELHRYGTQATSTDALPYFATQYNAAPEVIDPSLQPLSNAHPQALEDEAASTPGDSPEATHHIAPLDGQALTSVSEVRKRPRACDSCRQLKVACKLDEGLPCKRCKKAKRTCIITPPMRTRKRKGPDNNRISELERKVEQLTAQLASNVQAQAYGEDYTPTVAQPSPYEASPPRYRPDPHLLGIDNGERRASYPPSQQYHDTDNNPHKRPRIGSSGYAVEHQSSDRPQNALGSVSGISAQAPGQDRGTPPAHQHYRQPGSSAQTSYEESKPTGNVTPDNPDHPNIFNAGNPQRNFDHSDIETRITDIIGWPSADWLLGRYRSEFVTIFGAVPITEGYSSYDFLRTYPILFLSIISSTSYGSNLSAEQQNQLIDLLRSVLGDAIWKNGEKSLEIVQAIQVACLWYRPPINFEQHMFFQMIHFTAIMLLDMGFGKRFLHQKQSAGREYQLTARRYALIGSVEGKRAWLVSYFLCLSINVVLRRPILIRYNEYMEELLQFFETSKEARDSDRVICKHVRVARILEEIAVQFRMDDPMANVAITDEKVEYLIKKFERDLAVLKLLESSHPTLHLAQHVTSLYIHEIALHHNNYGEAFKNPFLEETFKAGGNQTIAGRSHAECVLACKYAVMETLRIFLEFSSDLLYTMPVTFSVRVIYSSVILIKLYVAATSGGELGSFINKDELRVSYHIDGLMARFTEVLQKYPESPHKKFLMIIRRLKTRYEKYVNGDFDEVKLKTAPAPDDERRTASGSAASTAPRVVGTGNQRQPDQGLHLLSEAAMGGAQTAQAAAPGHPQAPHQGTPAQWYNPVESAEVATAMMNHPHAMAQQQMGYPTSAGPMPGYEGYEMGVNGTGYDMDLRGLLGGEVLWNLTGPFDGVSGYQLPF